MGTLKKNGINIVVNMRGGRHSREEARARKLGMRYVSIPWHCPLPRDEPFARFLKLVEENPTKKIFVHCRLGDDRTGMAVAAYRMAEEGWSAEEAMKEMRALDSIKASHDLSDPGAIREKFRASIKDQPRLQRPAPAPDWNRIEITNFETASVPSRRALRRYGGTRKSQRCHQTLLN